MRILLLEDDPLLSELLSEHLSLRYEVEHFYDGLEAYDAIMKGVYELLLLDVGVPNLSGFELTSALRELQITTPIIFITSLSSAQELKKGFDVGGNDYLRKPFDIIELDARIENIIKLHHLDSKTLRFQNFNLDTTTHQLTNGTQTHKLSHKETKIFEYLHRHKGKVIAHEELVANLWQGEDEPNPATIRTYIKNLRAIFGKESIETIKGVGYVLHDM